jgi:hypothetical protein
MLSLFSRLHMDAVSCPGCRRRGFIRAERQLRGNASATVFTCAACTHSWKPTAAVIAKATNGQIKRRGPSEERPIDRGDSAQEPDSPLLYRTVAARLKADFDAVHREGMAALARGDYDTLGKAIKREREIIEAVPPLLPPKHGE